MIIESVTLGLLGLVGFMVKENTKAQNRISASLENLAHNIAYCPTNQKNKKNIKN